jgi:two-component system phosphate regulon sensor histidine kinase PhoR
MNLPFFSDRRSLAVVLLVVALCGLGWIQYTILQQYYSLSREKYDQEVAITLSRMGEETYERDLLSNLISAIILEDTVSFPVGLDSLRAAGTQFYNMYITDRFKQAGLSTSFEFSVMDRITNNTYFASKGYAGGVQGLGNYKIPLEGVITSDCGCAPYLNIRFTSLDTLLLREIHPIIWPAIGCFILLLAGFYLLFRLLQEQKYLERVKNDFINNLTHELKTPIFSISLATALIRSKASADLQPYVKNLEKDIDQLKEHVEKVLELASLENTSQVIQLQTIQIDEFIENSFAENSDGRIRFQLQSEKTKIKADPVHLRNAIKNLMENALKYSDGEVVLSTTIINNGVNVSVRDFGNGISREHQEAIFEKFYRINGTSGHEVKGFGLGLSYVKQVVKLMNGTVAVSSTASEGSTFSIKLPVVS